MRKAATTLTFAVLFWAFPLAFASDRTWVASTGSDSNPCTRSQPCATFQRAAAFAGAGGEVDVVDPGDYGPVHLFSGVTIDGGGMASITFTSFIGVNISLLTPGTVTLRNLTIRAADSGGPAIFADQCGACNNSAYELNLDNVKITGQSIAAIILNGIGSATIRNSVIEDVNGGLGANGSVNVSIHQTTFNNAAGTSTCAICASDNSTVTIDESLLVHNNIAIQPFTGATVRLSNSTITDNGFGLFPAGGTIISFVNNRIYGNGTNGAPTQSVYQR